jgi:spore germination protein YaaH
MNHERNQALVRHSEDMALIKRIFFNTLLVALGVLILLNSFPVFTFAASTSDLEVAGWIPYWRDSQGIKSAKKNLGSIDIVFPFAFTMQADGSIKDLADLDGKEWKKFTKLAQKEGKKVVPTIMTSDAGTVHANLSYPDLRKKHIKNIVDMVEDGGFDGVDIDYESKFSTTKDHFSDFLTELKDELGNDKILACTIEARTPPESLYKNVPKDIEAQYSNDYEVIADVCDTVEVMTYDQQRADLKLNDKRAGAPYMPVADAEWVEKVIKETLKTIPAEKIYLGLASYGRHWDVTVAPNWYKDYKSVGALNLPDMKDVAKEHKVKPARNSAGEMGFSYIANSSSLTFPKNLKIPKNTPDAYKVSAQALAYANKTGKEVVIRFASYSDAGAMEQKIKLAKEYDLKGVALFKIDGEEDQKIWKILK